jgi:hypothetical protein
LKAQSHFLTEAEIELLTLSSQYITYIMGIRFLTDYLSGDTYYHTSYSDQNLRRCKAQFRLMQLMIDNYQVCREEPVQGIGQIRSGGSKAVGQVLRLSIKTGPDLHTMASKEFHFCVN